MLKEKNGNAEQETIVVKVGSLTLASPDGKLDREFVSDFVGQIAAQHAQGRRVVVVSSGAIRCGAERLNLPPDHLDVTEKQAAAAVGQGILMERYARAFEKHGIVTAQVLLTRDIIDFRKKYLNARNTLRSLLDRGVVPVVNENDTVAVEEIRFGDNDALSALTAILVDAYLLILLSDVAGLFDADPKTDENAKLIEQVHDIDDSIRVLAGGARPGGGTGGMVSKIEAAQQAVSAGVQTVIALGREPDVVASILGGKSPGTTFFPKETTLTSRKKWLAFGISSEGRLVVNQGARDMMRKRGTSLLPVGIVEVKGNFDAGACVEICDESGILVARGLSNYSSAEIDRIKGIHSDKIEQILGSKVSDDVVHRDNLAMV